MYREPFGVGKIYHIFNRGTDKRLIFTDKSDYSRFSGGLIEFNDKNPALNARYKSEYNKLHEVQPREKVVEILAYCLMPNHYHLLIKEFTEGGIVLFMKKLGTGYTMYFNKKYERSGALFQGRFKSVEIDSDEYLRYIPHYIHLNPLDMIMPWRDKKIDIKKASSFLDSYRWSSYQKYSNNIEDPVIDHHFLEEFYGAGQYFGELNGWVKDINLERINHLLLE